MHKSSDRNFGLDVLRATAILLVVLSHCTYLLPEINPFLTNGIRLLGATGVDVFFVLSGYLIGGLLLKKLNLNQTKFKNLFHFWKRRWLRTLPNYFVVLIVNVILILILNKTLVDDIWLYLIFCQNFASPHPDFFTEAWSLSIEEYAYLILPLIQYVSFSIFKKVKSKTIFISVTIITIAILFLFKIHFYVSTEIESYNDWSSQFRKAVLYRLDAIYYGFAAVYLISNYNFFKSNNRFLFVLGLLLFLGLHVLILLFKIIPEANTLFFAICYLPLISVSIVLVFPFFIQLKGNKVTTKLITYVSTRSYSIYLLNYSVILLPLHNYYLPPILLLLVYLVLTIVLSEALFQLVELPFLKIRKRYLPPKS